MSKQFPRLTVTITIYSELHLFISNFFFLYFFLAVCINCDCQLNVVCGFPRTETANLSWLAVCVHNKSSLDILHLSPPSVAASAPFPLATCCSHCLSIVKYKARETKTGILL